MQIKDWPLEAHQETRLVAIGSPDALGRGRQWRSHAYFETNGRVFQARVPWGMLPKLRPGSTFVDGVLAGHPDIAQAVSVEVATAPRLLSWAQATQGETGWLREPALQDEHCLVYDLPDGQLLVPCLQALRAFHAQTRIIAHALLRPAIIGELATGKLNGDEAQLQIQRLVPQGIVTRSFARYLARLLFEPAWLTSFSDVFHTRFAAAHRSGVDLHDRIALTCVPPACARSHWRVACEPLSRGRFLVNDFLSTRSDTQPPYRTLVVLHNRRGPSERPRKTGTLRTDAGAEKRSNPSGGGNEDPKALTRPALVRLRTIEHGDAGGEQVHDVYPELRPAGSPRFVRGGGDAGPAPMPKPESFDEERRQGGRTSAEFRSVPGRDTLPLHFERFIKTFADAMQSREGWTLAFDIDALSRHLPNCEPADRLVLLGRVTTPNTTGYVLELEPLQGQASYTLAIIRRNQPEIATVREIGARLATWLTASGRSHVPELLKEDADYQVALSTHRDVGTTAWANRILDKLDPPVRRPGWTRGQAN